MELHKLENFYFTRALGWITEDYRVVICYFAMMLRKTRQLGNKKDLWCFDQFTTRAFKAILNALRFRSAVKKYDFYYDTMIPWYISLALSQKKADVPSSGLWIRASVLLATYRMVYFFRKKPTDFRRRS